MTVDLVGQALGWRGPAAQEARLPCPPMPGRVDADGAAFAGSQLQTQLYVNERTAALDDAIRAELPALAGASLQWRSPLAADGYREYYGTAFLDRVDLAHLAAELKTFWPTRGPQWDALAVVQRPGDMRPGVLLVEGKSYPDEMLKGSPTTSPPGTPNRERIDNALEWTQRQLGVDGKTAADWTGELYQNANRLAHLVWLRSLGVRAWFVHLLFTNDRHRPTTAVEWGAAVRVANTQLGLDGVVVDGVGHVLLEAGTYEDLVN